MATKIQFKRGQGKPSNIDIGEPAFDYLNKKLYIGLEDDSMVDFVSSDSLNELKIADERLKYYGDKDIVPSDESYFTVNETGETITGLTSEGIANISTEVIIPYKINEKIITTLYSDGYGSSILAGVESKITKVILPNSIIHMQNGAFFGCGELKSINIPKNIESIESLAFTECGSLKSIKIPDGVNSIQGLAFSSCDELESIYIPSTVTSIDEVAFLNSSNFTIYCEQGSYAETYAKTNNIPVVYTDIKADSLVNNILDDTGTGSIHQKFDGESTFDFTDKNPNATSLDSTLTGNITKGATGNYASSFGGKSAAMGKRSLAEGTTTIAKGNYSHAEGDNSVALGNDSHAEGYMTVSKGEQSHAEGIRTISVGTSSHTEGYETESSGNYSHAEGEITKSTGESSHAEGYKTESAGLYSHAEGNNSKVLTALVNDSTTGDSSSTGGSDQSGTTSDDNWNVDEHFGEAAHVEGADNVAIGFASHAEGVNNKAHGHYAHAEGIKNIAGSKTEEGKVLAPHAEGYNTTASGSYSHTEGNSTKASGISSHAEGNETIASGINSHSEGHDTEASGEYSHAEGQSTQAIHTASHAEGGGTTASGNYSHAEGNSTTASSFASHAEGHGTKASSASQHVQGKFNIEDTDNKYAHIVGNGLSDTTRSNTHTLDWDGNAWFAGNVTIGTEKNKLLTENDLVEKYVKNIDYATYDKAGILSVGNGLIIENDKIHIDEATEVELEEKCECHRSITPDYIDTAVYYSTHQDMSDDYLVTNLKTSDKFEGTKGELPASYNAVKNYIDNSIQTAILDSWEVPV